MNQLPDCVFDSSNDDGVPDLLFEMQGDFVDFPMAYGSVRRDADYRGRLLHFYVDDYRFNALGNAVEYGQEFWKLWERPDRIWRSGAPSFCEINFSTSNSQPRARAIWQIYKKRHLSRYLQERGMRCFVDLNVAPRWWEENLLGVKLGWKAWSTRIHRYSTLESLTDQASVAESHAGNDNGLKFVVYGNRKEVEALCQRQGWIYVSEQKEIWSKRVSNKTRSLHSEMMIEPIRPKKIATLQDWC